MLCSSLSKSRRVTTIMIPPYPPTYLGDHVGDRKTLWVGGLQVVAVLSRALPGTHCGTFTDPHGLMKVCGAERSCKRNEAKEGGGGGGGHTTYKMERWRQHDRWMVVPNLLLLLLLLLPTFSAPFFCSCTSSCTGTNQPTSSPPRFSLKILLPPPLLP